MNKKDLAMIVATLAIAAVALMAYGKAHPAVEAKLQQTTKPEIEAQISPGCSSRSEA